MLQASTEFSEAQQGVERHNPIGAGASHRKKRPRGLLGARGAHPALFIVHARSEVK